MLHTVASLSGVHCCGGWQAPLVQMPLGQVTSVEVYEQLPFDALQLPGALNVFSAVALVQYGAGGVVQLTPTQRLPVHAPLAQPDGQAVSPGT